jgi:hypothetical protein
MMAGDAASHAALRAPPCRSSAQSGVGMVCRARSAGPTTQPTRQHAHPVKQRNESRPMTYLPGRRSPSRRRRIAEIMWPCKWNASVFYGSSSRSSMPSTLCGEVCCRKCCLELNENINEAWVHTRPGSTKWHELRRRPRFFCYMRLSAQYIRAWFAFVETKHRSCGRASDICQVLCPEPGLVTLRKLRTEIKLLGTGGRRHIRMPL